MVFDIARVKPRAVEEDWLPAASEGAKLYAIKGIGTPNLTMASKEWLMSIVRVLFGKSHKCHRDRCINNIVLPVVYYPLELLLGRDDSFDRKVRVDDLKEEFERWLEAKDEIVMEGQLAGKW